MNDELLNSAQRATLPTELPDWTATQTTLSRTIDAPSFLTGIELVAAVARAAEDANHHPDIDIRWRAITFTLSTHDAGGLTDKDLALAHRIDVLAGAMGRPPGLS